MAQAKDGDTVRIHYTGRLDDGEVFDSSTEREPLQFTLGAGQVIPGFEQGTLGMNPGEAKTINIPADKAYGPHRKEMVMTVDRKELPEDFELKIGMQLRIPQEDGRALPAKVTDISESNVTLDANHSLAGKDLTFDIELVEIV
ncbi:MAG: FKBP-type peptidyl-prolyl cis-trans isomerase [Planctomycetota bacterium]|jgi:peptidylprolyl isomerase